MNIPPPPTSPPAPMPCPPPDVSCNAPLPAPAPPAPMPPPCPPGVSCDPPPFVPPPRSDPPSPPRCEGVVIQTAHGEQCVVGATEVPTLGLWPLIGLAGALCLYGAWRVLNGAANIDEKWVNDNGREEEKR